ncbi:MAG: DUF898 family protein [Rhodobacteraceae bacterium]|nr:DUF898 family protein [Paracoccaceae bacterium]
MLASEITTDFAGKHGPLFMLALKTSMLTVLTLGIYRFWMKTRLRRYYWSSVRPGGAPLEYVGEPIEKLLGFLIAVVVMAFYLGIVNLVLMFVSFSFFQNNTVAYALSFMGVVPIWFYALYRARRYVLARTRWRGIRFALEPGAWGYAVAAIWHWALTILSAGLLWPRMTFKLEKYRTDRTFYGDHRLTQGGRWTMLFRAAIPTLVSALLIAGGIGGVVLDTTDYSLSSRVDYDLSILYFVALGIGLLAFPFTLIHYRVKALQLLTRHKTAGDLGLNLEPSTARVTAIVMFGNTVAFLIVFGAVFVFSVVMVFGARGMDIELLVATGDLPAWVLTIIALITYFFVFVLWGVLRHIFVTQPLWRHYAEVLTVTSAPHLAGVQQRDRDAHREAEGFAEALDLGAAI